MWSRPTYNEEGGGVKGCEKTYFGPPCQWVRVTEVLTALPILARRILRFAPSDTERRHGTKSSQDVLLIGKSWNVRWETSISRIMSVESIFCRFPHVALTVHQLSTNFKLLIGCGLLPAWNTRPPQIPRLDNWGCGASGFRSVSVIWIYPCCRLYVFI